MLISQTLVTGPVGTGDGSIGTGPLFSATIPNVHPSIKHKLVVRAVTKRGIVSLHSNGQHFDWRLPSTVPAPTEDPCLPWPARNLPKVVASSDVASGIEALRCKPEMMPGDAAIAQALTNRYPLAIRVGDFTPQDEIRAGHYPEGDFFPANPTAADIEFAKGEIHSSGASFLRSFNAYVFRIPGKDIPSPTVNLFPVVVYRAQIPNPDFPSVSGDLVQVTPYIDKLAEVPPGTLSNAAYILKDPYFMAAYKSPDHGPAETLLLLDNQPVLLGAAYRYYLVRFADDGEIDRVIRTNAVTVTP
jgi:hypothetical protein